MVPEEQTHKPGPKVVVIAASAGGINALYKVLERLPPELTYPIVVVQHRGKMKESHLTSLLGRHTRLTVKEAKHGDTLEPGTVYLGPAGVHVIIEEDGKLSLSHAPPEHYSRPSADMLFRSAARAFGSDVVGVVLSGSGSDGADGVRAIHRAGGFTIAQNWDSSAYFGMPGAAIATGEVDAVLPLTEIADAIVAATSMPRETMPKGPNEQESRNDIDDLLEYLRDTRGFDFRGYKRSSLSRRVSKRMSMVGVLSYSEYIDFLEVHPDEFARLFDTILINVTDLFRDNPAWEYLKSQIIPQILKEKPGNAPIRVWSAGCATGQEAYSLAIAFAEQLGPEAFRDRVKIYATDLDEGALTHARHGCFTPREVQGASPELLEKYFENTGTHFCFDKELRRNFIFGRHDLINDAPISRVDMLVCRNTLMYFNAEIQARILARFHFALNDNGFLFLGKAETLLTHANMFAPVDLKMRVFRKLDHNMARNQMFPIAAAGGNGEAVTLATYARLREAALEAAPLAQLIVDSADNLAIANARARQIFNLAARDIGRPLRDLEVSYRPVEIRSLIEQASRERRAVLQKDVEWKPTHGESSFFQVQVYPISDPADNLLGAAVSYLDVTLARQLQTELQHYNQELETAYEELQSTNEELQTTNEELQSTVEELETTNEELQSTNEELETMNEELQSTNEELETINSELSLRTEELKQVNTFTKSILASLSDGVVVLDPEMIVMAWNARSEDLWGLREEEVIGKHFFNLDIGLPAERIRPLIRDSVRSSDKAVGEMTTEATNRRGKAIRCRVIATPLNGDDGNIIGTILLTGELPPKSAPAQPG